MNLCRKAYVKVMKSSASIPVDFEGQEASDLIRRHIEDDKPLMVARFGASELNCMVGTHWENQPGIGKHLRYMRGDISSPFLREAIIRTGYINAGIFPPSKETIQRFSALMFEDMKELDILGRWLSNEKDFIHSIAGLKTIRLQDIEPYYHANPWSEALKGKKVLVVHPFENTIQSQYSKRELLFENPAVLPEFELKTVRAVQTIAGNNDLGFQDWFDALEYMKGQIDQVAYDIAIIGCGAYGFPLAAHVKRQGKKAIHMGGATQILFGIRGKRWENHPKISTLFNPHWAHPSEQETPSGKELIENGCYW